MSKSKSPTPKKVEKIETRMDFPTAIAKIIEGKNVSKLEWNNKEIYGYLKDGYLVLRKDDGKDYQWVVRDGDMLGLDWIVVESVKKSN